MTDKTGPHIVSSECPNRVTNGPSVTPPGRSAPGGRADVIRAITDIGQQMSLPPTFPFRACTLSATLVLSASQHYRDITVICPPRYLSANVAVTLLSMPANLDVTLASLPATLGVTLGLICRGNVRVTLR
jgi:hypothetical protein